MRFMSLQQKWLVRGVVLDYRGGLVDVPVPKSWPGATVLLWDVVSANEPEARKVPAQA